MQRVGLGLWLTTLVVAAGCGGATPSLSGTRESGQSGLMDSTLAGQNCKPENHERPFVIEWDATDMGRFEQFAKNDVVVVKYDGCRLEVLDRCRDDSASGRLGAYKPVEWSSGSLETIDIATDAELAAELPLGAATLGGRVKAGEKFHMEYYVAGTRSATRSDIYARDLRKLPGCEGATHFVYNYNLGAFALGSVQEIDTQASVSLYGFGAEGRAAKSNSAEKQGGDLATCKSDSIAEVEGCKAPIRLTLRPIKGGADPDSTAEDTDESLNAAGKVARRVGEKEDATQHLKSAEQKLGVGDGKGCLESLDAHDRLEPKNKSTDPKSGKVADLRGQCLMLSGKCKLGKKASAAAIKAVKGDQIGVDRIEIIVEQYAAQYCKGGDTDQRTKVLAALTTIRNGGLVSKTTPDKCMQAYQTVKRDGPKVKDDSHPQLDDPMQHIGFNTAKCLAKAGDCDQAWKVFEDNPGNAKVKGDALRSLFESMVPSCKR